MTIQIEKGKFYRTRSGRKVGPMQKRGHSEWPWIVEFGDGEAWRDDGTPYASERSAHLIAEWTDDKTPTIWRDMTDEQRAPILLHWARGGVVQYYHINEGEWFNVSPNWNWSVAYRIKPSEPEPMTLYGNLGDAAWSQKACGGDTHSLTMPINPPAGTYTHESGAEITIAEVNQ